MLTWGTRLLYKATYIALEEQEKRDHANIIATVEPVAEQPNQLM
jgi:hypothetical protein